MMRNAILIVALGAALSAVPGCTPPENGGGVDWPKVARCAPGVDDIVGEVSRILLDGPSGHTEIGDHAVSELEQLAHKYGPTAVTCLVDLLADEWLRPGASANPDRAAAAMRGRDFLEDVGTRIERANEPQSLYLRELWRLHDPLPARGFVPIHRDAPDLRPWRTLLASARGLRA